MAKYYGQTPAKSRDRNMMFVVMDTHFTGDAAPGVSSVEAMTTMEQLAHELQAGIGYEWTGLSYQEKLASGQAAGLFGMSLIVVFLLLGPTSLSRY